MQASTTLPRNAKRQHVNKARPKPQKLSVLLDRGFELHRQGQLAQAQSIYEQVLATQPAHFDALHLLGVIAYQNKQLDLSLSLIRKAMTINPNYASAHSNLGNTLKELNRVEEALVSFERAIELDPDFEMPHNNRGLVLQDMGRVDEALISYDRAIALKPGYAEACWNKSLALLLAGDLAQGWEMFEWRWKAEKTGLKARDLPAPLWLGEQDISGKTLLIHPEQGLGDTIQFCRYAKLAKERGARVVMCVPKALMLLLSGLEGVDELVEVGQALPHFDYHCPMMSLPLAFNTKLDTIPLSKGYLKADPIKSEAWRARLGPKTRARVGLVWNGGFRADQPELWAANGRRNVELSLLAASLNHLDVDFYSLQKGEPAESEIKGRELEFWPGGNFHNYAHEFKDFSDTAALIDNLDLVVAVDTSTAHVAAALGKPTWILNRFDTCWRWLLNRNDSPWYDAVKLYRQDNSRHWRPVLQQVVDEITTFNI